MVRIEILEAKKYISELFSIIDISKEKNIFNDHFRKLNFLWDAGKGIMGNRSLILAILVRVINILFGEISILSFSTCLNKEIKL